MPNLSNADLIRRAAKGIEAMLADGAREANLTRRQLDVLLMISDNPGISQSAMLDLCSMDRSTLSGVVRLMHKRGYIKRSDDPKDQRAELCNLTTEGQAAARKAQKIKSKVDREIEKAVESAASFGGRLEAIWKKREARVV